MDKKKKIILISVIAVLVILVIVGVVCYFVLNNNSNNSNNNNNTSEIKTENSKVNKLYEELQSKDTFSFKVTLDDNNSMYYAKSGNTAYTDTIHDGKESKYVIRDGNSYLLMDNIKTYYTYSNNSVNLNRVLEQLSEIKDLGYQEGKEEVNNKKYNYEEFTGLTNFAIGDFTEDGNFTEDSENVKTRFYFDGNDLVYIKTIEGDKQELLKVDISYDVDQNLFQIPSDYEQA